MQVPDTLYHYCSTQAFHAIICSRSIRLSGLSLSNDTTEGKLVSQALSNLAQQDNLEASHANKLTNALATLQEQIEGLGFCLSEERDLLSQWRGYAEDATGVAIGFSKRYLNLLVENSTDQKGGRSLSIGKVTYDPDEQANRVRPAYEEAKAIFERDEFPIPARAGLLDDRTEEQIAKDREKFADSLSKLYRTLFLSLFFKLFLLKQYGFREEKEWRLVTYLFEQSGAETHYSAVPGRVIPYREYELIDTNEKPIHEVVLGPKHFTNTDIIKGFLKRNRLSNVEVNRSETTYR